MKLNIGTLVLGITTECNDKCKHCLRGEKGNQYMNPIILPKIFNKIDNIDTLILSGGEPSCYIKFVADISEYIVKNDIPVNGLYIVTNGREYRQELVDAVKDVMYHYFEREYENMMVSIKYDSEKCVSCHHLDYMLEEDMYRFGISVSIDNFHSPISALNYLKYKTSGVYSVGHETDFSEGGVVARGRGENIKGSEKRDVSELYAEVYEDDYDNIVNFEQVYISVDGKVFADCDLSYKMQEEMEPYGDVNGKNLSEILEGFVKERFY